MSQDAVILVNLGTPDAPTPGGVRRFLRNFLSDSRVVEIPRLIWLPILYGVILPFRPRRVAKLYQEIWLAEGSPLRVISERQQLALAERLQSQRVTTAMVYGGPSIADRVAELRRDGIEKILLLPLYPQYSATTTGSVYDRVANIIQSSRNIPDIAVHKDYHKHPDYIAALANSVREHWDSKGRAQRLLLSYHGIPQLCVDKGDPYYQQCIDKAHLLATALGLEASQWAVTFQSRLGKAQWLQPYTDKTLEQWGADGVESVDVLCPAFSVDCLETLEEIDGENREIFLEAGGKRFEYIPCLNDRDDHIQMMANIVAEHFPTPQD